MKIIKWVFKTLTVLAVLFVVLVLFIGFGMAGNHLKGAGDTWDVIVPSDTGIGGTTVFEIFDPGPGRRLQIRNPEFMNNEILGYIEKDGRITDPNTRQTKGRIDNLFNK